jgi:toxin HigB-1
MIKSFRHKDLEQFFHTGSKAGINAAHAARLSRQLLALNRATAPEDMNLPGWRLHPLHGNLVEHWAVTVSGNWRLTFRFEHGDAMAVDYLDYH